MRALLVVVLACGCGRIAFDALGGPADAAALGDGQKLDADVATKLAFTSSPHSAAAGECSGATTIETQDAAGHPVAVIAPVMLALTSSSTVTRFWLDPTCATTVDPSIAVGGSSVTFYWTDTMSGSPVLTAMAPGYSDTSQTETVHGAVAFALGFESSAQTVTAGTCSAAVKIVVRDMYGNGTTVVSMTNVMLSSISTSMGFFADSACGTVAIVSTQVPAGASAAALFYFKDTTAGTPNITATSSPLTSAMQTETVN